MIRIDRETLKESVLRVTPGMPYVTNLCYVQDLPDGCFPWHWHGEAELFYMRSGILEYHVPGGVQVFREGEAGFVNANVLHMTRVPEREFSIQEEHIFLPSFVAGMPGGDIETRYVRPVLRTAGLELHRFRDAASAISRMREAYELYTNHPNGFEMKVRALMSEVWLQLLEETREMRAVASTRNPDDERIKRMLSYISDSFGGRVTLEDIARAGLVGERECLRIFRRCLDMTPMDCVMSQRIARASEMLRATDMTILDIALTCGFCSASYFGKVFRERVGMTPREYRASR